jgi:hypothetical protein
VLSLPDPRPWPAPSAAAVPVAGELLATGDPTAIVRALAEAPSAAAYRALWETLCGIAERPEGTDASTAVTRYFALPIVLVAGARAAVEVAGVLPDVAVVQTLLETRGAVGPTRNFGLSNALVAPETLAAVSPLDVYRAVRGGQPLPEFGPAPVVTARAGEAVHLRYLVGAGIAPAAAPSFVETAANIGTWGMPLAQLLAKQLAQPGVELLALPRPPVSLLAAPHAGQRAQLEAAFNLFVSNELRRFRRAVGDPVVVVSAHQIGKGGAEVRITLSTPFDESLTAGFRWPLDPLDDLADIAAIIGALFAECRVSDVRAVPRVLPDLNAHGVPWFPRQDSGIGIQDSD